MQLCLPNIAMSFDFVAAHNQHHPEQIGKQVKNTENKKANRLVG